MSKHVVVIGGGVIGGFTAWYLAEYGHRVTLVDRGRFGGGASHGNCGYVSPSHVIPLARPGQVINGLRGLLTRQTALQIEPTRLHLLAPWLLKFALRCNARSMMEAGRACHPLLHRELGVRLPIQPGKGYSITMRRPSVCPRVPMILEECHVGITPLDTAYRIGSTMEFTGYDASLDQRRLAYLRRGAAEYLREPTAEPVEEEWCGWRPMTPDGIPYIDRSPRFDNVWLAAGHSMLGISMGTGTGRFVAELVSGRPPHLDPAAHRIRRRRGRDGHGGRSR